MRQTFFVIFSFISIACYSQGELNRDNSQPYEIVSFDSLVEIYGPLNNQFAICVEKKNILKYVNKNTHFYTHWYFQPEAYILWKPEMQDRFLEKFIKPCINDTLLIEELNKNFYPNMFPKIDKYQLVYNNAKHTCNNLNYKDVNCCNFIAIQMRFRNYVEFFYNYFECDPMPKRISLDSVADSMFIRILYPLPEY